MFANGQIEGVIGFPGKKDFRQTSVKIASWIKVAQHFGFEFKILKNLSVQPDAESTVFPVIKVALVGIQQGILSLIATTDGDFLNVRIRFALVDGCEGPDFIKGRFLCRRCQGGNFR